MVLRANKKTQIQEIQKQTQATIIYQWSCLQKPLAVESVPEASGLVGKLYFCWLVKLTIFFARVRDHQSRQGQM